MWSRMYANKQRWKKKETILIKSSISLRLLWMLENNTIKVSQEPPLCDDEEWWCSVAWWQNSQLLEMAFLSAKAL